MQKIILDKRKKEKISAQIFKIIVKKAADNSRPDLNSWFDLWHQHVDWNGDGKLSRLHRKFQLWALFRVLRKFHTLTIHNRHKYQIFAIVDENKPENDAVYIHTENPNNSPFPCDLTIGVYLKELPFWLSPHISLSNYTVGLNKYDSGNSYIIQRKN